MKKTQTKWDNKTLNYDNTTFKFKEWAISVIQEVNPEVKELEKLHLQVIPEELSQIRKHFHKASTRIDFMKMVDKFMEKYVPQRICGKKYLIQRYPTLRIVEPNQSKKSRRLFFHQGIWVGNGKGLRTIWMPFTECYESNSMQMLPLLISKKITKECIENRWSLDKFEEECLKHSFPITLNYGQCHLFFQEHIHGNVNNETNITRVSMDIRILVEGEPYNRKLPGGYFRFPGDYRSDVLEDNSGKHFITYDCWSSQYTKNIPLPMQRNLIDVYCEKNKIKYSDSQFENEYLDWCPSLQHFIKQKPEGIVMLSIFSLPDKKEWRDNILNLALEYDVELHFANEYLVLRNENDLKLIQSYLEFSPS
jgi:sporadic carbohydrate cluster 2OG-Fe(II) oxygenase/sporadic carbohydrate cluster protein (TIGR04323 family)